MREVGTGKGDHRQAGVHQIKSATIGEAWIAISRRILNVGVAGEYEGLPMRELLLAIVHVDAPRSLDALVERLASSDRLAWMQTNFTDPGPVAALGDADSYATRLRNYDHAGRDQVKWVIERLRHDPSTRSATITTFQPLSDSSYVPCVSLLDFFLVDGRLHQVVYAHSIDFGTKGFANLIELARLQEEVAGAIETVVGELTMIVKSAHVYARDVDDMETMMAGLDAGGAPSP